MKRMKIVALGSAAVLLAALPSAVLSAEAAVIYSANQMTDSAAKPDEIQGLSYSVHIRGWGWCDYLAGGETAGTEGKCLPLEAIKLKIITDEGISGSIQYRVYRPDIGWENWKENDAVAGTEGMCLPLEAVKIRLTGELSRKYDIFYRVHMKDAGWQGWKKNRETAGYMGQGKYLEAIEIKLKEKK